MTGERKSYWRSAEEARQPRELPGAIRELVREQVLAAQHEGMLLGSKYGAKTLRDIAESLAAEPNISSDYIRGLRDGAVFIERFAEDVNRMEAGGNGSESE